jgi:hypothetical protein
MCYGLIRAITPSSTPEALFEEGVTPTFGLVREMSLRFAVELPAKVHAWGARFFARVMKEQAAARALEIVNAQRNNLAHGRTSLPLAEMEKLVLRGLQLDAWPRLSEMDGEIRLADWIPWIVTSAIMGQTGLFERWQKNAIRYLVPETGEIFKVPRKNTSIN